MQKLTQETRPAAATARGAARPEQAARVVRDGKVEGPSWQPAGDHSSFLVVLLRALSAWSA